jgi:hypothetical protein
MAALTHTFISNTIAVGQKHTAPAPSTAPITGARRDGSGPLLQVTRGNGKWELWDTYDDQDILSTTMGGVVTLVNSVTTLTVHADFSYGTGIFINSPFAVSTNLVTWNSPSWTDPVTNGGGINTSYVNHRGKSSVVLYDKFIIVRTKDVLTSSDGVNWTSAALPSQWPYFSNQPGSNNGAQDVVEELIAIPGNKLQLTISTFIGYGYLANAWQTNTLESSDYGASWTLIMSFYGYEGIGDVHIISGQDPKFPNTSQHGSAGLGEVSQMAFNDTTGTAVLVQIQNGLGVSVFRSYDSGASWYSNFATNNNLFEKYRNVAGSDVGTISFSLAAGNGYWVAYMYSYPTFGDAGAWFYIQGDDWTNGSHGYAIWTKLTVNSAAAPTWISWNTPPTWNGTHWIIKDTWRGLQSTDLATWTAIPMKPKFAATVEGEGFFGED